jgi:hypothetical protein
MGSLHHDYPPAHHGLASEARSTDCQPNEPGRAASGGRGRLAKISMSLRDNPKTLLRAANCQLPTANRKPQTANCQPLTANGQPQRVKPGLQEEASNDQNK